MRKLLVIILLFSFFDSIGQPMKKLLRKTGGPTVYLQDFFADANGTSLASHTMNVGPGWTIGLSIGCGAAIDYKIQSNQAIADAGLYAMAHSDAGVSDGVASVNLVIPNSSNYLSALLFRYFSCSSYWVLGIERDGGGTPYMVIYKVEAGITSVQATVNVPAATNSTVNVKVTLSGNSIVALAGTGETCNTSNAYNVTETRFGLWAYDDGTYASVKFDNFLVTN